MCGEKAYNGRGIECVCFYVVRQDQETPKCDMKAGPKVNNTFQEGCQIPERRDLVTGVSQTSAYCRDGMCSLPPHNNIVIPYPRPAPSVELRGGHVYSGCQCVKRDGLQHDCPRTGCQGKAPCLAYPAPQCVPSGNAPPAPPSKNTKLREQWPSGGRHQVAVQRDTGGYPRGYHVPDDDDRYVRMGRCGYKENPPVKRRPRVPCEEHRKTRC